MKMQKLKLLSFYLWVLLLNNSLNTNAYRMIRLQDYLCADKLLIKLQKALSGGHSFTLGDDRDSAAIISQKWNATMPGYFSSNKLKYDCDFRVLTSDRPLSGIYTVITHLKFRRDPVTGECLDYIQFSSGNRSPSKRICNEISKDGPDVLLFEERDREVNIHIHVDHTSMIYEPLELRMVLTAHSECKYSGDFLCDPKLPHTCISRHFVRDNITNCLGPCRDEASCFHKAITAEEIDTTNVAISAITSLIFTMLGVGFCVWICWKYWNCITVQQGVHDASVAARRVRRDIPNIGAPCNTPNFDGVATTSSIDLQPQHLQQQFQTSAPKDLPPSYESLFPER